MSDDIRPAVEDLQREFDDERACLIRNGMPHFRASGEAQRIVSDRRRYARRMTDEDKRQAIDAVRQADERCNEAMSKLIVVEKAIEDLVCRCEREISDTIDVPEIQTARALLGLGA